MASITNKGSQLITWDFKHPAKGYAFNQAFRGWAKPGIYSGLTLSIDIGNNIILSSGHLVINGYDVNRGKDNLTVKVEFQSDHTETINQTTPLENEIVYFLYEYIDQIQDWVDIAHDSTSNYLLSPPTNAIIIGEITYDGGGNAIGFDYTRKNWGLLSIEGGYTFNSSTPFSDTTDPTKQLTLDVSSLTTATSRTAFFPDINVNFDSASVRNSMEDISSLNIHIVAEGMVTGENTYYGSSVTNAPTVDLYVFTVKKSDNNNILVQATNQTESEIYIKQKVSGVWGSWSTSVFTATDISGSDVHSIRTGPHHGTNVGNAPTNIYYWGSDEIPDEGISYFAHVSKLVGDKLWVIGGIIDNTGNASTAIRYYDFSNKSWNTIAAVLPLARAFAGISQDDTDLYIICGTDFYNNPATNTIYKIDTVLENVATLTPVSGTMPSRIAPIVSDAITVGTDRIIVVAGGFNSGAFPQPATDTIYWYNITTNSVTIKTATLPYIVGGAAVNTINDLVYVGNGTAGAGGYGWYGPSTALYSSIFSYDPNNPVDDATAITSYTATIYPVAYSSSEEYNGYIYYFGGRGIAPGSVSRNIHRFDYSGDSSVLLEKGVPHNRYLASMVRLKNRFLLIGGLVDNNSIALTVRYSAFIEFYAIDDWHFLYEKKNDTSLQITATDAYGSWKGKAIKIIYDYAASPTFTDWEYSESNLLEWYDITLLNGWITTGFAVFSKTPSGMVKIIFKLLDSTSASGDIIGILPSGYRPYVNGNTEVGVITQRVSGNSIPIYVTNSGEITVDHTLYSGSNFDGTLIYFAEL